MLLPINAQHPEPRKVARAVELVKGSGVIAYPTDTIYALGCDLMSKQALERLHQIKGAPKGKSLSFICPDLADISKYAIVDNAVYRVLRRFLPGPYTFILPASREVPKMVLTKQKTVGIRVPDHPVTIALVRELGRPLVTTTAARPDGEALVDPWEIDDEFPGLELVLDAGSGGTEPTTVVDLSKDEIEIIREGAGPVDDLV